MSLEVRIINATIDIFKEKGVKFTMDDLSNKLGVSKRTLYENIENKESLLNTLVDEVFNSIEAEGKAIINDESLEEIEKLKKILTVLPTSFNTIDYAKIYELKKFYPSIHKRIINRLDVVWGPTEELINDYMEKGMLKKVDLHLMKNILIGSVRNLLEEDYLQQKNLEYYDTMKSIIDIMFDGLIIRN